jgi:hypothetical protein
MRRCGRLIPSYYGADDLKCARAREVWPVDQNAEGSEVAPIESCSRHTPTEEQLPPYVHTGKFILL